MSDYSSFFQSIIKTPHPSASDIAYKIICEKILTGVLAPGTKLTKRGMADLTGVSTIPVIEAFHRLENEGLVESVPYYGTMVINLTKEEIWNRIVFRLAIESQVARILSHPNWLNEKEGLYRKAKDLDQRLEKWGNTEKTWDSHYHFHTGLAHLTGNPILENAMYRIHLFLLMEWDRINKDRSELKKERDKEADSHAYLIEEIFSEEPQRALDAIRKHIFANRFDAPDEVTW